MAVSYTKLWHILVDRNMKQKDLEEAADIADLLRQRAVVAACAAVLEVEVDRVLKLLSLDVAQAAIRLIGGLRRCRSVRVEIHAHVQARSLGRSVIFLEAVVLTGNKAAAQNDVGIAAVFQVLEIESRALMLGHVDAVGDDGAAACHAAGIARIIALADFPFHGDELPLLRSRAVAGPDLHIGAIVGESAVDIQIQAGLVDDIGIAVARVLQHPLLCIAAVALILLDVRAGNIAAVGNVDVLPAVQCHEGVVTVLIFELKLLVAAAAICNGGWQTTICRVTRKPLPQSWKRKPMRTFLWNSGIWKRC